MMIALLMVLGPGSAEAGFWSLHGIAQAILSLIITVAFWVTLLGTPGKLLMGCQVVDATSAHPMTLRQAVLRYLGYYVSALPLGLGFLWIAWDTRKQGFHDKIANTVVLYDVQPRTGDESRKSLRQLMSELR